MLAESPLADLADLDGRGQPATTDNLEAKGDRASSLATDDDRAGLDDPGRRRRHANRAHASALGGSRLAGGVPQRGSAAARERLADIARDPSGELSRRPLARCYLQDRGGEASHPGPRSGETTALDGEWFGGRGDEAQMADRRWGGGESTGHLPLEGEGFFGRLRRRGKGCDGHGCLQVVTVRNGRDASRSRMTSLDVA